MPKPSQLPADRPRAATLNVQTLRTFVSVVENQSFSKAASALKVSQPTISFQIANLEEACGVRLLNRRPSLSLTEVGHEFYVRTRIILGRFDELFLEIDAFKQLQRGRLSVGFSAPRCTMRLLAHFTATRPGITLNTLAGNTQFLLGELERGRIDVAIVGLERPDPQFACHLVEELSLCVWAPIGHPLAARDQVRLKDLAEYPLITREPGSMTRSLFEDACRDQDFTPTYQLEIAGREGVREAVAAGLGLSVVLNTEAGHDERVDYVPIGDVVRRAGTYLVHMPEMIVSPAIADIVGLATGS
jgi:DNA-binding transcriptional LysR family regulator